MQNKKPFEKILHVGRVTSLQSWVAKKLCHGQTLINECSISDYPFNFKTQGVYLKKIDRGARLIFLGLKFLIFLFLGGFGKISLIFFGSEDFSLIFLG